MAEPAFQGDRRPDGTFAPGVSGNPAGKPKGSHSVRTAWKRRLAAGFEEDTAAPEGEERVGKLALALAEQMEKAVARGDTEAVRALCLVIAEAEGKPQERVEHSGGAVVRITFTDVPDEVPE